MADILSFDEINRLYDRERIGRMRSMPYDRYFGEMDLSEYQIGNRTETAKKIYAFILPILASMYYMQQEGVFDYDNVSRDLRSSYRKLLDDLGIPFTFFFSSQHAESVAADVIDATMKNGTKPYYFSRDRARFIAENEANSIWNDAEYQDAIATGKRTKTWRAILDKRTRDTHIVANGTTIPIDQPFVVGESLLMFPHDGSLGASADELVNCRCSITYY